MQVCVNNWICSYNELHYCQFCNQYELLIKYDINFYYRLSNSVILLTTTAVGMHACVYVFA